MFLKCEYKGDTQCGDWIQYLASSQFLYTVLPGE